MKNKIKAISISILVVVIYLFLGDILSIPIHLLKLDTNSWPMFIKIIYSLSSEILTLFLIIFLLRNQLKRALIDIKDNHKKYFKSYFKYWFLIMAIMMLSNLIILLIIPDAKASNQQAINLMFKNAPIYTFISAVFLAPITEELVFRQALRNIIKNKYLFIFLSGFIFGGLHVFLSMQQTYELLYLIPYCTPGFIFAYILYKTDNIFVPIGLHFFHNGILMSLQVLLLILK